MPRHRITIPVTFGDCDPAAIVFYPNHFRWFDHAFHDWLARFGGHGRLCDELGAAGIGLMEAGARFRSPVRDGDRLDVEIEIEDWQPRSVRLAYGGRVGGRVALTGHEVRGLFVTTDTGLRAAPIGPLRARLSEG